MCSSREESLIYSDTSAPKYAYGLDEGWRFLFFYLYILLGKNGYNYILLSCTISDNYGIGSYRYIHYTGYGTSMQGKVLEGEIGKPIGATLTYNWTGKLEGFSGRHK